MSTDATDRGPSETAQTAAIVALALGGFAIGTTEFVTMGLLPQIADGVNASIPSAGHVITAYALGVVVGAPVIAAAAASLPRRGLLVALMALFAVGNIGAALAPGLGSLTAARFLAALPHGAYFGVASLVAASLVSPDRRARAVASVMMGLSVANVVGVPAATWLGQQLGWRSAYWLVAGIAALTMASVLRFVPHQPAERSATVARELGALRRPQVVYALLIGMIGFGGMFAMYSYIAPTVTEVGGSPDGFVPVVLAAFGLGGVAGMLIGGRVADRAVMRSMAVSLVATMALLAAFTLTVSNPVTSVLTVFLISLTGSVLVIALQVRLMDVAGEAQTLGAALNHASLNVANALGAYLGGAVIARGWGYSATSWVGVALAAAGLAILALAVRSQQRADRADRPARAAALLPTG